MRFYNVEDDEAGIIYQAHFMWFHLTLKKRGSMVWRMTWQALTVKTYLRCQPRVAPPVPALKRICSCLCVGPDR